LITNYYKSSVRGIIRHKLFSSINIIGFAASMSIGLLLISILSDVSSYDSFHKNRGRIYRITSYRTEQNDNTIHFATTSVYAGKMIRKNFPGIEDLAIVGYEFGGDFGYEDKSIPVYGGLWADQSFFNIFSFQLISGDPKTALLEPYSIVLTEESAKKIFGETDPMGRTLTLKNSGSQKANTIYTVTGILKDIPKFSHLQFNALGSYSTLDIIKTENDEVWQWENMWSDFVYVMLPDSRAVAELQTKLDILSKEENSKIQDKKVKISLELQPVRKIVFGGKLENEFSRRINMRFIWILLGLSVMVLFSAFFNYSNLSIARSLQRSHEIAIRKVSGAKRTHVLIQFIAEAVIISLISLFLSLFIFFNIQSIFFSQFPDMRSLLNLNLSPQLIVYFIIFALLTGIIAGIFPGLYFSKVNPISAIKNILPSNKLTGINIRKILILIQFVFSLIFITSTLIFLKQYRDFITFDLGFNTKNILNIRIQGNKPELLEKELSGIPEITDISKSLMITSIGNNYYLYSKYNNIQDSVKVWYNNIDENYVPLLGFKLKFGRNFNSGSVNSERTEIIVNEKLVRQMNIENGNSQNAIGRFITSDGKKLEIVGIIEDFHWSTLDREIGPFLFRYSKTGFQFINAKISPTNIPATLKKIQGKWKTIDNVHPFYAAFYTDQIKDAYGNYFSLSKLVGFIAILEILIASIGLFGMVVFSLEVRLKEIGVRKVFGADFMSLTSILSRGFLFLILIAAFIALPVVYIVFEKFVLIRVIYHSPVGAFELFSGTLVIIIISNLIIVSQIFRMTRTKPSVLLKNE
jgi:putative ABC transport system permease protein